MAEKRKCFMCGKEYEFCPNCADKGNEEPWKFLYHDVKCMQVSKIWYAYRGHEISKDEAKTQMDEYPDVIAMILKNDSIPAKEIKDIYGVKEPEVKVDAPVDGKKNDNKQFHDKVNKNFKK